jgi:SAM-dependent methyltransferase
MRPLTSFAKVRAFAGQLIRNKSFQLTRPRARTLQYLDVGCGANPHLGLINLDYLWRPGIDVCWDVRKGLPFGNATMRGVFSEHCLEHFPLVRGIELVREFRRVLMPGGTLRLVVPDGELYLRNYVRHLDGDSSTPFPYDDGKTLDSPMAFVNRVFYQDRDSPFGHCVMFDFRMLSAILQRSGFSWVERKRFGEGRDATLLVDSGDRQSESLYVEAGY